MGRQAAGLAIPFVDDLHSCFNNKRLEVRSPFYRIGWQKPTVSGAHDATLKLYFTLPVPPPSTKGQYEPPQGQRKGYQITSGNFPPLTAGRPGGDGSSGTLGVREGGVRCSIFFLECY